MTLEYITKGERRSRGYNFHFHLGCAQQARNGRKHFEIKEISYYFLVLFGPYEHNPDGERSVEVGFIFLY